MTIRDDIGALPPDAIAQVVRAYDDAVRACAERRSYNTAHAAGCAAFREALAAVLPQEAGAPEEIIHIDESGRVLAKGWHKSTVLHDPELEGPCVESGAVSAIPKEGVESASLSAETPPPTVRPSPTLGPSRALSEAAPREVTRFEVIDHRPKADENADWSKRVRAERDAARAERDEMAAEEPYAQAIKFRRERDAAEAAYLYRIKELAGLRGEVSRLQEALRELTARYGRPAAESGGPFL